MHTILKKIGLTATELKTLLIVFCVWRVVLFGIGAVADRVLPYTPSFPYAEILLPKYHLPRWVSSWANFDGVHYLTIAEHGYLGTGLVQAFFPLFPFVILHTFFLISGGQLNLLAVGLFFTNLFAFLSLVIWFGFLKDTFSVKKAWLGVGLFLCFPTALFWGALYTESLFFFAVIGSFWAARYRQWQLASIFALAATASRVVGIFLIPALVIECWLQWREKQLHLTVQDQLTQFFRANIIPLCWIMIGGLGLIFYMIYLTVVFHDPVYFLHVQRGFGAGRQETIVLYPQVVFRSLKILFTLRPFHWRYYTAVLEFMAGVGGVIGLLWAGKSIRGSYLFFALGAFFLPTVTGTFSSMPRYILVCFPLYLVLLEPLSQHSWLRKAVFGISGIMLIINTLLFIQGYWLS